MNVRTVCSCLERALVQNQAPAPAPPPPPPPPTTTPSTVDFCAYLKANGGDISNFEKDCGGPTGPALNASIAQDDEKKKRKDDARAAAKARENGDVEAGGDGGKAKGGQPAQQED